MNSNRFSVNEETSALLNRDAHAPLMFSDNSSMTSSRLESNPPDKWDIKIVAFIFVGVITLLYVIGELGVAITQDSLVLLSDGFHNLSDVFSLYIAYWARKASKWNMSHSMSYGWARSETLGALTNGMFLLSLCLYVILQTIPRFISPEPVTDSLMFIIVAAAGLLINTFGTAIFAREKTQELYLVTLIPTVEVDMIMVTGNSHGHGHSDEKKKKDGHSHSDEKKKKDGHSHSDEKKHGHGHGHSHEEKGHSHSHEKKEKKSNKMDANTYAVFLHYLGDAISSLMVLIAGLLMHFYNNQSWVKYIDPITSLLVVALILYTTIPLVKGCSLILLQSTPTHVDPNEVRTSVLRVPGIIGLHDFHVWQLVDGLVICSVHVSVEQDASFIEVVDEVKKIFHKYGIHSSAIQPEFIQRDQNGVSHCRSFHLDSHTQQKFSEFCVQNCVEDCMEDWCCKNAAQVDSVHP
ncbi:hypothetical protein PROFUN_09811 [Planoprotostelium fungivorum]|uniref:Uncharacterized protein n=1 Tax=Planoprotostelium fungivorum TaxID=1890364 RepID=A0A2P6NGS8_9EUKA|nr:hypothetical protein PROFUN_09811 [Planoprotostelium fungivorum]